MIFMMLEAIDLRVVRCGRPWVRFLGIQTERACFAGVFGRLG